MADILDRFSRATREWFAGAFSAPTAAQAGAWDAIAGGEHALVIAPTGSGKTLASFLWAIDRIASSPRPTDAEKRARTRVLYISPLKALGVDVERNLRSPLVGIAQTAGRLGDSTPEITVGVRSGDTPSRERSLLARTPPDILITTPESLYLMLTSAARETLAGVDTVIVDEVHAIAAGKRGAHLALSLERLDALLEKPAQRIGLSATVRPAQEVARFLGGSAPVRIVSPPSEKELDIRVVVPVDDMSAIPAPEEGSASSSMNQQGSIWPHVEEEVVSRVLEHRSTIVFVNSRRLAERLTARLNEINEERVTGSAPELFPAAMVGGSGVTRAPDATGTAVDEGVPPLARAHHGSVSKEQRADIEDDLKSGRLRCVVATSSLELGIDMGAVDLVIQVESPPSVASGLQRIGRAGHQVGEVSRGVLFPKHRTDLLHATVVSERMTAGAIEEIRIPQNPLDVLAQQTVAACALDRIEVDDWFDLVRRSAPFAALPRSAFEATLDLLSGLYPSDEFAEFRPRLVWDRVKGTLEGRPGAQRLAVTSGGTIPDRGLFGVFIVGAEGPGRRVGELDEEMVYESRVGDVFALGATSWRIEDITHDQVLVSPQYGAPGRVPFWRGDGAGRPVELGRAIGAFTRELGAASVSDAATRLETIGLDPRAAGNLIALLDEQKEATGALPTDRTLVVERFRDELGDWRLVLHSPFGMPVHAPWALAVTARLRERYGYDGAAIAADDGIVVRLADTETDPPGADLFVFEPGELVDLVTTEVGGSALFAGRFRECAARALLLPRRDPGRRSPLWQQRQRASQLLEVARRYPTFPIVLETVREVMQDVYDLPALTELAGDIASRALRLVEVATETPSPLSRSLLFGYVGAFLYEGDSPLAERRAAALSLDSTLLAELLGRAELRELLDPDVLARTEAELQHLADDRRKKDAEGVADLLRLLGPQSAADVAARLEPSLGTDAAREELARGWMSDLEKAGRLVAVRIAGDERWAVVEDAGRLRDALGVPLPTGIPQAFLDSPADPLGDIVARFARTHGPFTAAEVATRFGLGEAVVRDTLTRLGADRRVVSGEFRPGGAGTEWVDAEVLRRLRTRSLAALRKEIEPVSPGTLARFLPVWQNVGGRLRGIDGVAQTIEQLAGIPLPATAWENLVLPARVHDYEGAWLDELTASGEVVWAGEGSLAGGDGWISLHPADTAALTLPAPAELDLTETQRAILDALATGGAYFLRQLSTRLNSDLARANTEDGGQRPLVDDKVLADELWELVWSGRVTNDTLAPLRSRLGGKSVRVRAPRGRMVRRRMSSSLPSQGGPANAQGRWSLVPPIETDATRRLAQRTELLLERHGVVTRGAVQSEGVVGGFALVYRVLGQLEQTGRVRRGYVVEGLGAAQFGTGPTIDRLRGFARSPDDPPKLETIVLAATDPANPFGAALPWPEHPARAGAETPSAAHRPGRKAGAIVVLIDGHLAVYLEKGGKSALAFAETPAELAAAAKALVATPAIRGAGGKLERVDGGSALTSPLGEALHEAGYEKTPQGLRLRR